MNNRKIGESYAEYLDRIEYDYQQDVIKTVEALSPGERAYLAVHGSAVSKQLIAEWRKIRKSTGVQ